ncbi:MAG: glycosyltransferase family 25 protein [Rhodomicrobium sp.]
MQGRAVQIPILLINLDRSTDRLAQMTGKLNDLGLAFERIAAEDGRDLSSEETRAVYRRRFWRRELVSGEIGCYLSHLKAMRYMLGRGMDRAIILEDDLEFSEEFHEVALRQYGIQLNFDILKLEGRVPKKQVYFEINSGADKQLIAVFTSFGAGAYLITADAAKRALKRLSCMRYPFDDALFCNWRNGLTIFSLFPYPARQSRIDTTIPDRDGKKDRRFEKHAMRMVRIIPKNYDKVRKRIFQLKKFGFAGFRQRSFDELTLFRN